MNKLELAGKDDEACFLAWLRIHFPKIDENSERLALFGFQRGWVSGAEAFAARMAPSVEKLINGWE